MECRTGCVLPGQSKIFPYTNWNIGSILLSGSWTTLVLYNDLEQPLLLYITWCTLEPWGFGGILRNNKVQWETLHDQDGQLLRHTWACRMVILLIFYLLFWNPQQSLCYQLKFRHKCGSTWPYGITGSNNARVNQDTKFSFKARLNRGEVNKCKLG